MTTRTKIRKKLLAAHRKLREFRMLVKGLVSTRHPVLVHIIPIRRCNLACTYCNEFDDFSKPVPLQEMFRRIDRLGAMGTSVITISGGEPLLHPELDQLISHVRRRGVIAGMITNGYLLVADRIKRLNSAGLDRAGCAGARTARSQLDGNRLSARPNRKIFSAKRQRDREPLTHRS